MVIEFMCIGLFCKIIKGYNWMLYMFDVFSVNEMWVVVIDLEDRIFMEWDGLSLVFKGKLNDWENLLLDDVIYRLIGVVYLDDDIIEESEIIFKINLVFYFIDYDKGCCVFFEIGYVVIIEFYVYCDGWDDEDLFLSYEFK